MKVKIAALFFSLLLLLITGCPSLIVQKTSWDGNINNIFDNNKSNLELNFDQIAKTCNADITVITEGEKITLFCDGNYTLDDTNNYFYAELKGIYTSSNPLKYLIVPFLFPLEDFDTIEYTLILDGDINCYKGTGDGKYEFKYKMTKKDSIQTGGQTSEESDTNIGYWHLDRTN